MWIVVPNIEKRIFFFIHEWWMQSRSRRSIPPWKVIWCHRRWYLTIFISSRKRRCQYKEISDLFTHSTTLPSMPRSWSLMAWRSVWHDSIYTIGCGGEGVRQLSRWQYFTVINKRRRVLTSAKNICFTPNISLLHTLSSPSSCKIETMFLTNKRQIFWVQKGKKLSKF